MMGVISVLIFQFVFLFFMMMINVDIAEPGVAGLDDDECKPTKCKDNGPTIRFPFRLKDHQPEHCGYPGFELSCNDQKHTVIELPPSVELFVNYIDYTSQQIDLYDPHSCLIRHLPYLNISESPFQFDTEYYLLDSRSLFNCSPPPGELEGEILSFPCLSTHGYQVIGFYTYLISYFYLSSSCKKMYDIPLFPDSLYRMNEVHLNWSEPMCAKCEVEGLECKLLDTNNNRRESSPTTHCVFFPPINQNKGIGSRKPVITGIILGSSLVIVVIGIGIYKFYQSNSTEKENQIKIEKFLLDYKALKPTRYSYADIKRITNQFKDKLGQGGYGTVFKGMLSNEVIVAVKLLNNFKGNGDEFINEVGSMGTIHHVNVARLVGFCADGVKRALVYEFLPNGSLEKHIVSAYVRRQGSSSNILGWEKLQDIALGIAKGIDYLHQGCDQRIIHLDIKPHNVLLDHNFIPKISDFGMAKLCSKEQSAVSMTTARGTMGYIAPEVLSRNFGNVSYKSDVYSFGMLLLEIVGGRKNQVENASEVHFPEWAYNCLSKEEELGMEIVEEGQSMIIKKLIMVGLWCIQWYPIDRPSMNKVVGMLELGDKDLAMPPNPFASVDSLKGSSTMPRTRRPLQSALNIISEFD